MAEKIAYIRDLRRAALNFISSGKTQSDGTFPLSISRSTIVQWLNGSPKGKRFPDKKKGVRSSV